MSRSVGILTVCAFLSLTFSARAAEEAKTAQELRDLRALVEKQSKQLDTLTEQVSKLGQLLENRPDPALRSTTAPTAPTAAAPAEFSTEIPKAEPADGKRHVVVKGETLTSIAKHYSITISELQKANKGVDERKLQIGQTLTIPTKAPEPSTEKKENP
ncbi:MAG: Peptidoglycan-binding LysM [Chthoniobacter sp.]|jgi:LysM repeat protein|nr:Peptidoglycan-binding LysM [Chthoniobacter sp.]